MTLGDNAAGPSSCLVQALARAGLTRTVVESRASVKARLAQVVVHSAREIGRVEKEVRNRTADGGYVVGNNALAREVGAGPDRYPWFGPV